MPFNFPPGCTVKDIEGEQPICDCGNECHEGETECPRCQNSDDDDE